MKKLLPITFIAAAIFMSTTLFAQVKSQNAVKAGDKIKKEELKTAGHGERTGKGLTEEKIIHAEERSNGNAFSGKGRGGDKNRINPGAAKSAEAKRVAGTADERNGTKKKRDDVKVTEGKDAGKEKEAEKTQGRSEERRVNEREGAQKEKEEKRVTDRDGAQKEKEERKVNDRDGAHKEQGKINEREGVNKVKDEIGAMRKSAIENASKTIKIK